MTESFSLSQLLLPELERELALTRKTLSYLPEGQNDFKPHEKSTLLAKLAGHTALTAFYITRALTFPDMDMLVTKVTPIVMESVSQLLTAYDEQAARATEALKSSTDDRLLEIWTAKRGESTVFSGPRYAAYRMMGVNHMIHHRAQLGVYLRLLNQKVPSIYGPSADEQS